MADRVDVRSQAPVRAVVLDIGGVLEHVPETGWRERWARRLGVEEAEANRLFGSVFSGGMVGAITEADAERELSEQCDALIYSHEAGCIKPDPRAYAIVCERLGVTPAQTVFLDDTPACVEGARAVGMRAILFEHTAQAIAAMQHELAG